MGDRPRRRSVFRPISRGAARAAVFLFALSLIIGALNFLWTAKTVGDANRRAQASCGQDRDLAGLPLAANPRTGKATRLGVQIIADARIAFRQAGCEGRLPPADPSFTRWARYYHLPAG